VGFRNMDLKIEKRTFVLKRLKNSQNANGLEGGGVENPQSSPNGSNERSL
jgi:hypothetical protein